MQSNVREGVLFPSASTYTERSDTANICVRKLGIKFPALIDDISNQTEEDYTGWPDRLYLIDRDGRIAYKSRPGPFGFKPQQLADALSKMMPNARLR